MDNHKGRRYAPEVRERAVRLVQEHEREYPSQWAAIRSIAEKMGCRWSARLRVTANVSLPHAARDLGPPQSPEDRTGLGSA
jgi:transposase-like protein